jgi:hypothetical protein
MSNTVNLLPQPNLVILTALQNSFQFMYVFLFHYSPHGQWFSQDSEVD